MRLFCCCFYINTVAHHSWNCPLLPHHLSSKCKCNLVSDFQQKCQTIWRFVSRFKGSGSNKWNCLLFCFLSGFAARCHPVICSVNERKLDALQLTRFNVYFHVQCGIKMWIDFVYWVICKQKMNHNIWETRLLYWLIDCIIMRVRRDAGRKCNYVKLFLTFSENAEEYKEHLDCKKKQKPKLTVSQYLNVFKIVFCDNHIFNTWFYHLQVRSHLLVWVRIIVRIYFYFFIFQESNRSFLST